MRVTTKGQVTIPLEIRERLSMEQFASFRDQYVAELRRGAAIQIRMAELDAAASN